MTDQTRLSFSRMVCLSTEGSEVFRVRKSNHSKKIVKQLKREYKEDLEKSGNVKQEIKSGVLAARVKSVVTFTLVTEYEAGLGFSVIFNV